MRKKALLILPEKKFNEREFNAVREALIKNYISFFIASDAIGLCTGDRGSKVKADVKLVNIHPANFDGLCIIGGEGIRDYFGNKSVISVINRFNNGKKTIAAICAASVIIAQAGVLDGKTGTCFPADKKEFLKSGVIYSDEPIVKDKHIITAKDAEASTEFATLFVNTLLNI